MDHCKWISVGTCSSRGKLIIGLLPKTFLSVGVILECTAFPEEVPEKGQIRTLTDGSRRIGQHWLPCLRNSTKSSRAEDESNRTLAVRVEIRTSLALPCIQRQRAQLPSRRPSNMQDGTVPDSRERFDEHFVILRA